MIQPLLMGLAAALPGQYRVGVGHVAAGDIGTGVAGGQVQLGRGQVPIHDPVVVPEGLHAIAHSAVRELVGRPGELTGKTTVVCTVDGMHRPAGRAVTGVFRIHPEGVAAVEVRMVIHEDVQAIAYRLFHVGDGVVQVVVIDGAWRRMDAFPADGVAHHVTADLLAEGVKAGPGINHIGKGLETVFRQLDFAGDIENRAG